MRGKKRAIVVLIGVLSLLALPMAAVAEESEEPGELGSVWDGETLVEYVYNTMLHVLVYGFNDPEATEPLDCTLPEGVTIEIDDEGQIVVIGGELPEGCSTLNAEGPNGQVNHGTFMSALVHAIRATFDGDTPFGHYVRGLAKSDLGKGDDHVKGPDGTEEPESAESTDDPKPNSEHGKSNSEHGKSNSEPNSEHGKSNSEHGKGHVKNNA